jgi:hypothetical protein
MESIQGGEARGCWLAVMGTIDIALRRKWPASEAQALAWFVGSLAVAYAGVLLAGSERQSRANADNHRWVVGSLRSSNRPCQ